MSAITLKEAHARSFPNDEFLPAAIRPSNPEVFAAVFLNEVFGVPRVAMNPLKVHQALRERVLNGDTKAVGMALALFDEASFPRSKSYTGNAKPTIRITHPAIALHFSPGDDYGVRNWAEAFLYSSGLTDDCLAAIRRIADAACRRPLNLLEQGVVQAAREVRAEFGSPKVSADRAPFRLAVPHVVESFRDLIETHVEAVGSNVDAIDPDMAESALFDIVRCYEIHVWMYWVQIYLNAETALANLRSGVRHDDQRIPLVFGYETETYGIAGRLFAGERNRMERDLYTGAIAVTALINIHHALELKDAIWFDQIDEMDAKLSGKERDRLRAWLEAYVDAVSKEKGKVIPLPPDGPADISGTILALVEAMSSFWRDLSQNQRTPYTTTYGVVRSLGYSEHCPLMFQLGAGRGAMTMVDRRLIMLVGRLIARGEPKVQFGRIMTALEGLGMVFDDDSKDAMVLDLEEQGLIQKLSDSGEALYVQVH